MNALKVGDVWLCRYDLLNGVGSPLTVAEITEQEILEICGSLLRVSINDEFGRWVSQEEFADYAVARLGTARRFLGIRLGVQRDKP